jgi:cob(I)alamin adenosyltransferase
MLARVQNDLFDLGADLSVPGEAGDRLRMTDGPVARLESEAEAMKTALPKLTSFILPGGEVGAAHAHLARTIVRRAECEVVRLTAHEAVTPALLRYMNRLSDHLFILGRVLNGNGAHDVTWVPGGNQ